MDYVKVRDGSGDIICFVADDQRMRVPDAHAICSMLNLGWCTTHEAETYAEGLEVAPIISGGDCAAIEFTDDGVTTWAL